MNETLSQVIRVEIPHEKVKCEEVAVFMLTSPHVLESTIKDDGTFVLFFKNKKVKVAFMQTLNDYLDIVERDESWNWISSSEELLH